MNIEKILILTNILSYSPEGIMLCCWVILTYYIYLILPTKRHLSCHADNIFPTFLSCKYCIFRHDHAEGSGYTDMLHLPYIANRTVQSYSCRPNVFSNIPVPHMLHFRHHDKCYTVLFVLRNIVHMTLNFHSFLCINLSLPDPHLTKMVCV